MNNSELKKYYGLMISLLIVFVLFFNKANAFEEDKNDIIIKSFYHEARARILESGWQPAENLPNTQEIGVTARYFRKLEYHEVSDCTGAGILLCTFYFQNEDGEYLKIGTRGEYPHPDYDLDSRVIYAAPVQDIDP